MSKGTDFHSTEIMLIHDGTTVSLTQYGVLQDATLATFDADISGANVRLRCTPTSATTTTIKFDRTLVECKRTSNHIKKGFRTLFFFSFQTSYRINNPIHPKFFNLGHGETWQIQKNFRVEYGINSGSNEVINSSGKVVASAVSTLRYRRYLRRFVKHLFYNNPC